MITFAEFPHTEHMRLFFPFTFGNRERDAGVAAQCIPVDSSRDADWMVMWEKIGYYEQTNAYHPAGTLLGVLIGLRRSYSPAACWIY